MLSQHGLNQLSTVHNFTQIRITCSKPSHGRRLDIMTTTTTNGIWARDWMLARVNHNYAPPSCGSYERLPQDSSYIGSHCERWRGEYENERWFNAPIYSVLIMARHQADTQNKWVKYFVSLHGDSFPIMCDDDGTRSHISSIGKWSFYLR